jgi:hypothetical protein
MQADYGMVPHGETPMTLVLPVVVSLKKRLAIAVSLISALCFATAPIYVRQDLRLSEHG